MSLNENQKYNFDDKISRIEYEVIFKFLESYKNQNVIVADRRRQDFSYVPLDAEEIIFKSKDTLYERNNFCRKINHKGKVYLVELYLSKRDENDILSIESFTITSNDKVHFISLNTFEKAKQNIWLDIINTFSKDKVISPEKAYGANMYNNKILQFFIERHAWAKIAEGIKEAPYLANALFVINEGYKNDINYYANFGTILYQLIIFRTEHMQEFTEKDLLELDKLILELRKSQLLKVELHEQLDKSLSWQTRSILLESNKYNKRIHESKQFNIENGELTNEKKALDNCVKSLKKSSR